MVRLVRFACVATFVCVALIVGTASADPANKNASVLTFDCQKGSERTSFQAVGILQSAQIAGQVLDGTSVVKFVRLEVGGQVLFDSPGQAGRPDLWTCEIAEFPPNSIAIVFLTPRG